MDITLINTRHITLYFSTYQMGFALTVVPNNRCIYLMIGVLELELCFIKGGKDWSEYRS